MSIFQVNVLIPHGNADWSSVPLILTGAGQCRPAVNIAIQ